MKLISIFIFLLISSAVLGRVCPRNAKQLKAQIAKAYKAVMNARAGKPVELDDDYDDDDDDDDDRPLGVVSAKADDDRPLGVVSAKADDDDFLPLRTLGVVSAKADDDRPLGEVSAEADFDDDRPLLEVPPE